MEYNILSSPLSIYKVLSQYFLNPQFEVEVTPPNSCRIKLQASTNTPVVWLEKCVDYSVFLDSLKQLSQAIQLAKIAQANPGHSLDPRRFSIDAPLSDWQSFRRVMYERENGNKFLNLIIDYLQNETQLDILIYLGLSPEQTETECNESTLSYFEQLGKICKEMKPEQGQQLFALFREKYPNVAAKIIQKMLLESTQTAYNPYLDILKQIQNRIIGQDEVVQEVSALLASQYDSEKNAVYLFVGPTGVGKTELAKAIASVKGKFVSISMVAYEEETSVTQFFGSGGTYVGCTDLPHFAKSLQEHAVKNRHSENSFDVLNTVILLDEFEKAHPVIKQAFLTMFDEGVYKINYVNKSENIEQQYKFKKCVFACTSNAYQEMILESFQRNLSRDEIRTKFKKINHSIPYKNSFSPELLARVKIVPFSPIPKGEPYRALIKMKLHSFLARLREQIRCKEIAVAEESLILASLENRYYGNGTDFRQIELYFPNIEHAIYSHRHRWNDISSIKITLIPHNEMLLSIQISQYFNLSKEYFALENITIKN